MQRLLLLFVLMAMRAHANEYSPQEKRSLPKENVGFLYSLPLLNRMHSIGTEKPAFFLNKFTTSRINYFKPDCAKNTHTAKDCYGDFIEFVAENTWSPMALAMAGVYALQKQVFLTHKKTKETKASLSNSKDLYE